MRDRELANGASIAPGVDGFDIRSVLPEFEGHRRRIVRRDECWQCPHGLPDTKCRVSGVEFFSMSVTSLALAELTARAEPAKASKMTGLAKPAEDGNLDIPLMSITSLLNFIHSAICRSDEDKSTQTFKLSKDFQGIYKFTKLSCLLTSNSEKTYN